jgi:hypothetical protein
VKVEECWSFVELGVPFRRVGWELDAIKLNKWFLVLEQSDCHPDYDIANVGEKNLGDRSRQNWDDVGLEKALTMRLSDYLTHSSSSLFCACRAPHQQVSPPSWTTEKIEIIRCFPTY